MICLQSIQKSFDNGEVKTSVLKGVDLNIERGEFAAIMGASGSGKSTLMYIIGCMDRTTGGTYLLDGKDISALNDDELSRLRAQYFGFVFQS